MTAYSTVASLPLPENSDILVAETTFGQYASALDSVIAPAYATNAARDAAMAAGKSAGMVCIVNGEPQMYDGSAWWMNQDSRYDVKTADTARTSTATPTADPHLSLSLKANGVYHVNAYIAVIAVGPALGLNTTWSTTGSAFSSRTIYGPTDGVTSTTSTYTLVSTSPSTAFITGTPSAGASAAYRIERFIVTVGGADDTLVFLWAPGVVSASAVTVLQNSFIEYRRIA